MSKSGWYVEIKFKITLHNKDIGLLKLIQSYFGGVGNIKKDRTNYSVYSVNSLDHLLTEIIPHFDKYPLITQKLADYLLFKEVVMAVNRKEHLTAEGIQKIMNIRATLNHGLSPTLQEAFPNTIQVPRPICDNPIIPDPEWMAGFTSGEGCFIVNIRKSQRTKQGSQIALTFSISQHSRDEKLMRSLVDYLGCGRYYPHSSRDMGELMCKTFQDNYEKIIPFLNTLY